MSFFNENYSNNDLAVFYEYPQSVYADSGCLPFPCRGSIDPFFRVVGYPDVQDVTFQLQHDLLPSNKITLKLDVSWTCHSHIIGKAGNTIQPVVRKTGVSIHFPDGNKNSETQKSNQVSINSRGEELGGLEEARAAIRELTPLIFTFALPATAQFLVANVDLSLLLIQVQDTYNVQAELQVSQEKTPVLLGSVKGMERDAYRVKEATLFLLQNLCGNLANQMPVQIKLEISPQNHSAILGKNSENIKKIMQITSTKIVFPDSSDPSLPPLSKYSVTISGAIKNVYLAKQNIIGCLPLVLMFDLLPEQPVTQHDVDQIMYALGITVIPRSKRVDGRRSVIMKSLERDASNLYEAWRLLTKTAKQNVKAKIPQSYAIGENTYSLFDIKSYNSRRNVTLVRDNVKNVTDTQIENVSNHLLIKEDNCHYSCSEQSSSLSSSRSGDTLAEDIQYILDLIPDRRAPGCERKQLETNHKEDLDYFKRKLLAFKAMKQPVTPKPRTPTSNWSGDGFSKSMPGFVLQHRKEEAKIQFINEQGLLGTSWGPWAWDLKGIEFIETLLKDLQLEQYIDLFNLQRVDLQAFSKLTDQDLKDFGIVLFGHRKKLLMAIKNLEANRQRSLFYKL